MRNKIYCLLLLLLPNVFAQAQTNEIDSLKKLLQAETRDTSRVNLLARLSDAYPYLKPDTAILLAQQGLSLARKAGFTEGESKCLNAIGNAFLTIGNYPKALESFLEALKKAESINSEILSVPVLPNIGTVYADLGDDRQAIYYYLKSLAAVQRLHHQRNIALMFLNLGDSYEKLNILDSARYYTQQCYVLAVQLNYADLTGVSLNNLGNIYSKMGQDAAALNYYRSDLPFLKLAGVDDGLCETYLGMAKLFQKTGNTDSSLYYAKLALDIGKNGGFTDRIMNACNFLTNYYRSSHQFDSAFAYQSAAIVAKDSLFSQEKSREIQNLAFVERMRQEDLAEAKEQAHTQLKFNALIGSLATFLIVALLLYRSSRQQRKARGKIQTAYNDLKSTQAQLVQSEKMASLGELTAGIAHEIQNPLNFVNNFSDVNKELLEELKGEANKGNIDEVKAIADDLISNEEKINHHGKRADAIVKGMLQHSRSGTGVKEATDINKLVDEYLRLAYHGFRAKEKEFNAKMETDFDESIGKINIIPQDMGRVLLNLYNNAFYALGERRKVEGLGYEPTVSVITKKTGNRITITVSDNGNGIPQNIVDKIFQPFFTTKPTGSGTGLGLSLSYDIVKAHGGEIKVETKEGEGTKFIVQLPFA